MQKDQGKCFWKQWKANYRRRKMLKLILPLQSEGRIHEAMTGYEKGLSIADIEQLIKKEAPIEEGKRVDFLNKVEEPGEEKAAQKKEPFLETTWEGLKERIKNIKDEELLLVTWKEDGHGK